MGVDLTDLVPPTIQAIRDLYANASRAWRAGWLARYKAFLDRHFADERDHERTYLGMSVIGGECEARLWFAFRWAHEPEAFDGRMKRLFETGHLEEARVVADLAAIGVDILEVDPETGEQFGVIAVGGHVRGHMDGIIRKGLKEAPRTAHLFENKTHKLKSFEDVKANGVEKTKPAHYHQMQDYMHLKGLTRAFYVATCKDNDEIYVERVKYDPIFAAKSLAKGERIVTSQGVPARLAEPGSKIAVWKCSGCPAKPICHEGAWARRNCRTCLHSTPELDGDGRWSCARHGRDLSKEDQRTGCGYHLYIPDLVPGKQVDADLSREEVTYTLRDGSTWVDGAEARP